jgi:hypothetical protein
MILPSSSYLQQIFSTHIIGYSLRQKIYNEFLEMSVVEKQFNTILGMQMQQHALQFTDLFVVGCIIYISSLYFNDLKYKKSFENIVVKKKYAHALKLHRFIEYLFLIFAIIFTKDVENAI